VEDKKKDPARKPKEIAPVQETSKPPTSKPPEMPADVRDRTHPGYLADLAGVHLRYGAAERALPLFQRALQHAKSDHIKGRIYSLLGSHYQARQDWAAAAKQYESLMGLAVHPAQKANAAMVLSRMYQKLEKPGQAERVLHALCRQRDDPKAGNMKWIRRNALKELGRMWKDKPAKLDQLIRETEAAVERDPRDEGALEQLAEIYSSLRRNPKKAAAVYERLRDLHPDDLRILQHLAGLYQQSQRLPKALEVLRVLHANSIKGIKSHYAFEIARLMIMMGQKEEALAWAGEHLAKGADDPSRLALLASFYERADMRVEAENALKKALEKAQTDLQRATFRLRIAEAQSKRKEYVEAEKNIRAAIKLASKHRGTLARARSALVDLYRAQDRLDELKVEEK
jgi:tetratricopeptide (TPR) repeat protein